MKAFQLMGILMLISYEKLTAELILEKSERRPSVVLRCMVHLTKTYFNMSRKMSLTLGSKHQIERWPDLFEQLKIPVIVNAGEVPKVRGIDGRTTNNVVFIYDDLLNVTERLNHTLWTADTHFIVRMHNTFEVKEKMMDISNQFFTNNVVNLMLLVDEDTHVPIYSFVPFTNCHGRIKELIRLGECSSRHFKDGWLREKISKGVINMNGCQVNVSVVEIPPTAFFPDKNKNGAFVMDGTEAGALLEISKMMNFTPWFAIPNDGVAWGWIEPSPKGVTGDVFKGHSQFGLGDLAPTVERFEYLQLSIPTSPDIKCITWAVPTGAGKRPPTWISILVNEYPGTVWILILVSLVVATAGLRILLKFSQTEFLRLQGNAQAVFYMFSSAFGVPVRIPESSSLRILFLSWIWHCFILVTAYQSAMGSKLTVPPVPPDINTFRDLIESDLELIGLHNSLRLVRNTDQEEVKILAKRLVGSDNGFNDVLLRMVTDRDIGYIQEVTIFLYQAMTNAKARGQVHVMKQCVYLYLPVMLMEKKSPYTKRVNEIMSRLSESGIFAQWRERYMPHLPLTHPRVINLSLKHMIGPFFVLGVGYAISVAVFSGELFYFHRISKKNLKTLTC